ncbi:ATP-grasp domain-containing protein [Pseudomonas syringae]|uniref:ATP-grasp domain-containing protein n=1 Tax=Pseudomonas syringae group TaxID=136849 RepID=UPI00073114E1|nr:MULTISPECIES: ATP-grasp domain-containing protein [Pseudomonas syringae group]KTB97863.1 biotin carboxylase [Pseudomonas syringae ICMP 11168]MCF8984083.1 ATP-grasp domain-containing protein [Pseudomonas syringae]
MNSNRPGVLILSHCGFSFLEDLKEELHRRQLRCFVLTSLPLPEHVPARLEQIQGWADRLYTADSHQLSLEDVNNALQTLRKSGEHVTCCISVWEGYRHLMAAANATLGTYDIDARQALALRNKLEVRNQLAKAGLSQANAYALTAPVLEKLQAQNQRYFIKPIHGIASYAAFPMRKDTNWGALEELRKASVEDTVYASAFNDGLQFMAEDYIAGQEFSFETLLVDGQAHAVAVHEKYEVTETADTVLEDSCTTPPASLDQAQIAAGLQWLKNVLGCMGLKWGCYHVEARFTGQHWDLIEINPRVGGSLISHSVEAVTGGHSMLSLWLDLLLASQDDALPREALVQRLTQFGWQADGSSAQTTATFFRVYFAKPGTLSSVTLNDLPLAPVVKHILLKAGDVIPAHAREVFLGQLLWTFDRDHQATELERLARLSATALDIQYNAESH